MGFGIKNYAKIAEKTKLPDVGFNAQRLHAAYAEIKSHHEWKLSR